MLNLSCNFGMLKQFLKFKKTHHIAKIRSIKVMVKNGVGSLNLSGKITVISKIKLDIETIKKIREKSGMYLSLT